MIVRIGARFKRLAQAAVISVGLAAASAAGYGAVTGLAGNFHTVKDGQFYRSAQLSKDQFTRVIQTYRDPIDLESPWRASHATLVRG